MGETNTGADEEVKDTESENGADNQDESQNDGGASDEGTESDENAEDGSDKDTDDDKGGGSDDANKSDKKGEATEKKPTQNADEKPPTRKRNADFIIERKNAKIAKLKDKGGEDEHNDEDNQDDDGVAPEDAEIIDRRVKKILAPVIEKQVLEEDKAEIADFVSKNPDFKPYSDKVLKWAQHPSRKGIPIQSLFYEVAGNDLLKIGADRAKKASDKAKESNAGGGNNRGGAQGGSKPVWEQSPEEFEAEQAKVRNKQPE
jgi:hypothetical protein